MNYGWKPKGDFKIHSSCLNATVCEQRLLPSKITIKPSSRWRKWQKRFCVGIYKRVLKHFRFSPCTFYHLPTFCILF